MATRRRGAGGSAASIPDATVSRLPLYLRALNALADKGIDTASSGALAQSAGVTPAQLRKDLSFLGSYGTRGVGYDVDYLTGEIAATIGLTTERGVVIVGLGNLGQALAKYSGFGSRGFRIAGLLDESPDLVGTRVLVGQQGMEIRPFEELSEIVRSDDVSIGVIAVPAPAAQAVCSAFVDAGVRSLLNFAPCVLSVPAGVIVRQVDLATELQILAFHEQNRVEPHHLDDDLRAAASATARTTGTLRPQVGLSG